MSASDQPHIADGRVWTPRLPSDSRFDSGIGKLIAVVAAVLGSVAAIFAVGSGLRQLAEINHWMTAPLVYQKDFLAGYLLAEAMAKGVDPFLPLNVLSVLQFGQLPARF